MFDKLLESVNIGSLNLSSRVVMAPMTRNQSPGNIPGEKIANYYRRRAENGVGLIITEGTVIEPLTGHGYPDVPDFAGEASLAGWARVVEDVHKVGGKIFPQLWHVGSVRQSGMPPKPEVPGLGPSSIVHPSYPADKEHPSEMSQTDIDHIISAFADGAANAETIGFDGVEIHGAHGYLIDQFFWNATNKRTDAYGGSTLKERTRFAVEIIKAVRKQVASDFPVCFRFSQWKMGDFKHKMAPTPQELEIFLSLLTEAGVDMFHCSTRRFFEPEFPESPLNLAGWTKKITGKPVITVGSVGLDQDFIKDLMGEKTAALSENSLHELLDRLEKNEFDLVAVGRALLADCKWVTKICSQRFDDVRLFTKQSLETLD